ncbi:MAG: hypothetical protein EON59_18500 [Alphaproteobacteria bacterium]|nr:MAG: hypothetical protein EON59_18500 [Alphaproteobacteria bacterium]
MLINKTRPWTLAAAVLLLGPTNAEACLMAPPASPEETAARTREYQSDLWTRSDSIFVARVTRHGTVQMEWGRGLWTELTPVLQLKGERRTARTRIQHTVFTSCGPAPILDALHPAPDEFYIVYSTSAAHEQGSINATLRLQDLVDPLAVTAWSEATASRADQD